MVICIDPGHSGSYEPGVCAAGVTEAAVNLSLALAIGSCLETAGHGVIFTRQEEVATDELWWRAELANQGCAQLFLSVHCNGAANAAAYGVETFYHPASFAGRYLAAQVQEELVGLQYTRDRGIKSADFAILRWTEMPAILLECGFLTHPQDREILVSPVWQKRIAAAVARGMERVATAGGGCW